MSQSEAQIGAMSYADVTAVLRRIMPDLYFVNTPVTQMRLHLKLLTQLPGEGLVLDFQRLAGGPVTQFTVCAYDDAQPGLLAKVCGTLAALRVNIQTAFVYSLRLPKDEDQLLSARSRRAPDGRRAVLDTLLVDEPYGRRQRALTNTTMRQVREELARVLGGELTVDQLLERKLRRPYPPLRLDQVSVRNNELRGQTVIRLRGRDEPGVLYRTATALAALGLDIAVAQIDTADSAVEDIFYVTDANGQALPETELRALGRSLRLALAQ